MFELLWDEPPPIDLLENALRRVMGRYPLLTCRLVPRWRHAAWEGPYGDPVARVIDKRAFPERAAEDDGWRDELRETLMSEPLAVSQGDLWRITQVMLTGGQALWFVRVHHSVGDAHGWLQVLDALLEGISRPEATGPVDRGSRDLIPYLARIQDVTPVARSRRRARSPWVRLSEARRRYRRFSLGADLARRVLARARAQGSTLTDAIHVSVARAIENLGDPIFRGRGRDWIRLLMAVDCRVMTSTRAGLANFSRLAPLEIPTPVPGDWARLLSDLRELKASALRSPMVVRGWPLRLIRSLPLPLSAFGGRLMLSRPMPISGVVTNFGALDPWLPHAADVPISTVESTVFCLPAAPLVVTVSSFRERLTISTGVIEGALPGGRLAGISEEIRRELERSALG